MSSCPRVTANTPREGFTLVEVVIGVGLITLMVLGAITLLGQSLGQARDLDEAQLLASASGKVRETIHRASRAQIEESISNERAIAVIFFRADTHGNPVASGSKSQGLGIACLPPWESQDLAPYADASSAQPLSVYLRESTLNTNYPAPIADRIVLEAVVFRWANIQALANRLGPPVPAQGQVMSSTVAWRP